LGWVSFFQDVSSEMIYPLLPLFLVNVLGAPTSIVGLIEGIAESTASLLKVFSGWLSDRTGHRKTWAVAGYGLSALVKPMVALARGWPFVLFVRFADRFGKGVRTAPRDALIAASTDQAQRGRAFGFHRAMDTAGAALGPLLASGLLLLYNSNYRPVFAWALVPGLISVAILIIFVREVREAEGERREPPRLSLKPFSRTYKLFLLVTVLFTLGNSSDAFLVLRAQNLGVPPAAIPLVWLLFNVVYSLVSTPAGILSDRIGRKRVMVSGYLVFALVYLGFALAGAAWEVWGLFVVYGVYYGVTEGVARAFAADLVPGHLRGTAFGVYHTLTGLALLPASLIAGWLWQSFTPAAPFAFGAVLSSVAAVLLAALL